MALLLVESLPQSKSIILQAIFKALELMLLSTGLYTLAMVRASIWPQSCQMVFSILVGFWNSIRYFFSSSLCSGFIIHLMVLLLAARTIYHHNKTDNEDDDDIRAHVTGDHNMSVSESSLPSQPLAPHVHDHNMPVSESPLPSPPAAPPPSETSQVIIPPSPTATMCQDSDHDESLSTALMIIEQSCSDEATTPVPEDLFFPEALLSEAHEIKQRAYSLNFSLDFPESAKEEIVDTPLLIEGKKEAVKEQEEDEGWWSKSSDQDEEGTIDATWKAITGGGKQKPKKKHLKKSGTWDMPSRKTAQVRRLDSEEVVPSSLKWRELRKAETFNDAVSMIRRGGLIRRGSSMNLDDLNKQVEAFIKKFKDSIKLQRQESQQKSLNKI